MNKNKISQADWRMSHDSYSTFESAHILLGYFLADRTSKNPINNRHLFPQDEIVEWEYTHPLEKVINSRNDLDFLITHPNFLRNSITIIEPWDHVALNTWANLLKLLKTLTILLKI